MSNKPTALVTSGPTREKIDPVRFISNFSSGKQGHAIAKALYAAGFDVTLVTGPVSIKNPPGIKTINIETAEEMLEACLSCLPTTIAVCVAAVCDFRVADASAQKIKKPVIANGQKTQITLNLIENPDILKIISNHELRPKIVVGFAAETENLIPNAQNKLHTKNCNIIIANDVSMGKVFGKNTSKITIISRHGVEQLNKMSKSEVAEELVSRIVKML